MIIHTAFDRTPYTYYIHHIPTNQHYYGVRWAKNCHPTDFWIKYFTSSRHVKQLIKDYGKESFYTEVRRTFTSKELAVKWEQTVLLRIKAHLKSNWLNKNIIGVIFNEIHPLLGVAMSDETKSKISASNKGKKRSIETKNKMSISRSGINHWNYGKHHSDETREKNKQSNIISRNNAINPSMPPRKPVGSKLSEETKQKISISKIGKKRAPFTEEAKKNMSASRQRYLKNCQK